MSASETGVGGRNIIFSSRDGLLSVSAWTNGPAAKGFFVNGATTPFAFVRDGLAVLSTQDTYNLGEAGLGYRIGLSWFNRGGRVGVRVGHLKHNLLRANVRDGSFEGVDAQITRSWPITFTMMDYINIGPLRIYDSVTGDRLAILTSNRVAGYGNSIRIAGSDLTKSRLSSTTEVTILSDQSLQYE